MFFGRFSFYFKLKVFFLKLRSRWDLVCFRNSMPMTGWVIFSASMNKVSDSRICSLKFIAIFPIKVSTLRPSARIVFLVLFFN